MSKVLEMADYRNVPDEVGFLQRLLARSFVVEVSSLSALITTALKLAETIGEDARPLLECIKRFRTERGDANEKFIAELTALAMRLGREATNVQA